MVPHREGDLIGAEFKDGGETWISLGRGPGNTVIGYRKGPPGRAQVFIFPLPKAEAISKTTPVDAQELEVRP